MHPQTLLAVLWRRNRLERLLRCTRAQLEQRQLQAMEQLRAFAVERSPFYGKFHQGFERRPWAELPVLTKSDLMENFDELLVDRSVRLADVEAHLEGGDPNHLFRNRYVVLTSSGSTGHRSLFLFNPSEWLDILAASTRPLLWAGVKPNLFRRQRMAVIGATSPWHYSAKVGQSLRSPFFPVLQLDAGGTIDSLIERLNDWRPDVLTTYPSVLRSLTEAQLAGQLQIQPRCIYAVAEVFTPQDKLRVREAFGIAGRDIYGATECSPLALECPVRRMHLMEDCAMIEIVDDHGRPVPEGTLGSRVLLTTLHRRTQPLIRYEITDMVRLSGESCECGRPLRVIDQVEGRQQNVLQFGAVRVHPVVFHQALERVPATAWQIIWEPAQIRVCLLGLADGYPLAGVAEAIRSGLQEAGADAVRIRIERVNALRRGRTGKADPVVTLPEADQQSASN